MPETKPPVIGLLLVGSCGCTASAIMAGVVAMTNGVLPASYGVSSNSAFSKVRLPGVEQFRVGGWDFFDRQLHENLTNYKHIPQGIIESTKSFESMVMPGIVTDLDFPAPEDADFFRRPPSVEQGAVLVASDIETFASKVGADRVVVVYLGSPSRRPPGDLARCNLTGPSAQFPASLIYGLGAIMSGSDFVDFTPSFALEYRRLWEAAKSAGSRLAGRDGSTGQTMIKESFAELFSRRGLVLDSWYSTNVLGNNDGFVLSRPEYGEAKLADKTDALDLPRDRNLVDIRYMLKWGDRKESWDAAECISWLGGGVSVRINWRGSDSELAAPLVIDLARLLSVSGERSGFRPEFGFFFKRPFEREGSSLSERWNELVNTFAAC